MLRVCTLSVNSRKLYGQGNWKRFQELALVSTMFETDTRTGSQGPDDDTA